MTTIEKGDQIVTLINVFTVEPAKQKARVELLIDAIKS